MEFWREQITMTSHLTKIRKIMAEVVPLKGRFATITRSLLANEGKMLRPALLVMAAGFDDRGSVPLHLAAALEYLHMASLVHDDIIDHSKERRGVPSVVGEHGPAMAIYTGDYLIFLAARCMASLDREIAPGHSLDFMAELLEAEANQLEDRFAVDLTGDEYLKRIEAKTGLLFSLAASAGYGLREPSEDQVRRITQAGLQFGVAYQLRDDLLDFEDPSFGDLVEGNLTMPVLTALEQDPELKPLLSLVASESPRFQASYFREITHRIRLAGGLENTEKITSDYLAMATSTFGELMAEEEFAVYCWMIQKLFGELS